MSYAVVVPNQKFQAESVQVKDYHLGKNKLWNVNDGELLIHSNQGDNTFLRDIGVVPFGEKANYFKYSNDEMKSIFKHYYQNGELLTVNFNTSADDNELNDFLNTIRYSFTKTEEETTKMVEFYEYITEDLIGDPWYFSIVKEDIEFKVYQNSVMVVVFAEEREEELALSLYKEIFSLLGKEFKATSIKVKEKEKVSHPMKNAHKVLSTIFDVVGEDAPERLDMSEEEFDYIKSELLKYTKEFETQKVYK